jgi:hypothetical protein
VRNAYSILVGNPENKRPLGRRRWAENIRMDLCEVECECEDWLRIGTNGWFL